MLMFAAFATAQNANTSLRGTVFDTSAAVIRGAQVSLTNTQHGFTQTRTVDAVGNFQFVQLPPGPYTFSVEAAVFAAETKTIDLMIDQPATLYFSLRPKADSTSVSIFAQEPALNATDATMGNALDSTAIQTLPVEGDIPDLLSLQPGVLYLGLHNDQSHDSRSGSTAGARSDQNNSTLDGLDNNDQVRGYAFTGVLRSTLDSVEEFRVTTTNNGVDSGRSSGAQVNIVTKSGTNTTHGSLYEYNRNTLTVANDWFNKQAELASGSPNVPGDLGRNAYGASLGG